MPRCARAISEQRFGVLLDIKEPYNFTITTRSTRMPIWWWRFHRAESASTLEAMRSTGFRQVGFALTSDPQSPIGCASDGVLDINTGIESVGFVTRGFSATVLNLLLIALIIARAGESQRGRGAALSR